MGVSPNFKTQIRKLGISLISGCTIQLALPDFYEKILKKLPVRGGRGNVDEENYHLCLVRLIT